MSQVQGQNTNDSPFSLINYQAEIQISDNIDQYQKAKHAAKKLDANPSPQDVLNNMIPPRDWKTDASKFFMQYVSHSKSSRDDVFTLKQSLQEALQYRQARKQGICSIRQQLFSQGFDQIIRQVTINCPQRGLLLMRVRDQHKMTLASYQTLYKSSVQYGMKKQVESQQGMDEIQNELKEAEREYNEYFQRKIQLQSKKQSLQKKIEQKKQIQAGQRQDQLHLINEQARNLSVFLTNIRIQKQQKAKLNNPNNNNNNNNVNKEPNQKKEQ